jgi:NAD(P)-dependent dehydrogenase (short-subunit alcohol dehydrogenase family)/acyl carrier protein
MHYATSNGAPSNGVHKPAGTPPASAPSIPTVSEDEVAQVMLGYQNLMARFLDTQRSVMMAYLQGDPGSAPTPLAPPAPHASISGGAVSHGTSSNGATAHYRNGHAAEAAAPKTSENGHTENGHAAAKPQASAPTNRMNREASPPAPQPEARMPAPEAPVVKEAPKTPPAAKKPAFDREDISGQLLDLVSERTGYPHDMLDVDLDLEADLGIDSIKRVEILGSLAEILGMSAEGGGASKIEFERLTSIRTIRGILDYLEEALAGEAVDEPSVEVAAAETPAEKKKPQPRSLDIQRGLVELTDAPLPSKGSSLIPSGAVLITDDGRGVATEIADRLADFGQECVFVRHRAGPVDERDGVFYADLTDETAVVDLATRVRKSAGMIGGLAHLLPLAEHPTAGADPLGRIARDVKGLYLLARELEDDLRQAGRDGGALLLAATGLGGGLGLTPADDADVSLAGHGGVAGFLKSVGEEWPEVLVRVIDLDRQQPAGELADCILGELNDRNGPREVGYLESRRVTWRAMDGAIAEDREPLPMLDASSTLLLTGGARGITSAIAEELARRFQCNLVLVGRSPALEGDESPDTAGLETPAEIKAALIARMKRDGGQATPAAVQAEYSRIVRDREIRGALERIAAAGSKAIYRSVDVRDEGAMAAVIAEAESTFGPLEGVIHGAGVIEDKLLRDKTPESFDRVFGTKIESALALTRLVDFEKLKFCVLFASVASRYGNRGQSDYAAANEVLAKLAWRLDRQTACRVLAIDWGPWSGIGMVSDLEKHLVARGLKLIDPPTGVEMFIEELLRGRKGESEVIIGGGAEHLVTAPQNEAALV